MIPPNRPAPDENLAKHAARALNLINHEGHWCKNTFSKEGEDGLTQRCATQAIRETARTTRDAFELQEEASIFVQETRNEDGIISFNDHPDTTHQDIVKLFLEIIDYYKEEAT